VYRRRPELFEKVHVLNGHKVVRNLEFRAFLRFDHSSYGHLRSACSTNGFPLFDRKGMGMHNAGRVQVLGQHKLPWVLADHTDVVIAYQWDVFDGYEHLDAMHGGYPLVHNSVLYKVYYRSFSVDFRNT
jgi:hypothetical protein